MNVLRKLLQKVLGVGPGQEDDTGPIAHPQYERAQMDAALKEHVVPRLRAMGFKGSLPHFYRERAGAIDVLTFQFNRYGGKFVVEMARLPSEGIAVHGAHVPPSKMRSYHGRQRHRLGSDLRSNWGDQWFAFAHREPSLVAKEVCAELDKPELWRFIDTLDQEAGDP